MPRSVDHGERRRHIAAALLRVIEREGMEAVSVRTVAAEAGCSVGAIQRYFTSKDEMLRFALAEVIEASGERLRNVPLTTEGRRFPEALRAVILAVLPLDAARRGEALVWAAFHAQAASRPDFAAAIADVTGESRALLLEALRLAEECGRLRPCQDHEALAQLIMAVMDGLMWAILVDPDGVRGSHLAAVDATVALMCTDGEEGNR
ncbi:TetR/AcrR family transcriptional regulator [Nonomuraea sp. NPDC050394]|uniref:TetR/AcrR family transcriptional regulator n=1 Tax=Nonomuraea sp. NPDC050394 TaxID=3364363 RepID=UPI0037A86252